MVERFQLLSFPLLHTFSIRASKGANVLPLSGIFEQICLCSDRKSFNFSRNRDFFFIPTANIKNRSGQKKGMHFAFNAAFFTVSMLEQCTF